MKGQLKVSTPAEYLASLDEPRRSDIAERYREALPKASIGKSCVGFKRLADVDQKVSAKMLREASKLAAKA